MRITLPARQHRQVDRTPPVTESDTTTPHTVDLYRVAQLGVDDNVIGTCSPLSLSAAVQLCVDLAEADRRDSITGRTYRVVAA